MAYKDMFCAGAMRYRVTILRPIEAKNSVGEVTHSWATLSDQWAAIEQISGREIIANSREEFSLTHRVVIRGTRDGAVDVLPQFKLAWGTRTLEISSVISIDRGRWTELLCAEIRRPADAI